MPDGLDMNTLSTRLQTHYIPGVEELKAREFLLEDNVKRAKDVKVQGNKFVSLNHTGRNEGHGFRAEGEDLPSPGYQEYNTCEIPVFYYYHKGQITGQGLAISKGPSTYITEIKEELKRIMTDALREFNIYNFDNQQGIRATVLSVSGTTITCRNTHIAEENGVNKIRTKMRLSVRTATANRAAVNAKVLSVNYTTNTFTLEPGTDMTGIVSGDFVYIVGNWDAQNGSKQCLGIRNAFDDGSEGSVYLGIPRAGNNLIPEWQSIVLGDDTAPTALTLAQLQNLETLVDSNAPEPEQTKNNIYITTFGVRDAYFLNLIANTDRKFIANDKPLKYDAGFVGLDYNKHAWYVDRDCPRGHMFYINPSKLRKAVLDDWDFLKDLQGNGGILILRDNKDVYSFTMRRYYSGPYTVSPRMNGVRKGIQDSGNVVIN